MVGNFLPLEFDQQDHFQMLKYYIDVIAQSCRNAIKYELNELAITSGSFIMMPFSLMEVLGDLQFLPRMVLMLDHTFLLFRKELKKIIIILLSCSSGYFSE